MEKKYKRIKKQLIAFNITSANQIIDIATESTKNYDEVLAYQFLVEDESAKKGAMVETLQITQIEYEQNTPVQLLTTSENVSPNDRFVPMFPAAKANGNPVVLRYKASPTFTAPYRVFLVLKLAEYES